MGRGRERLVRCNKCGRRVRKDKAVFIDKVIFSNPIDRKDIIEGEPYTPVMTRQVAYCPSCGKHMRVYEKKKRQQQRKRERRMDARIEGGGGFHKKPVYERSPQKTASAPKTVEPEKKEDEKNVEGSN
jgi:ribosomal protein S26